MVEVAMRLPRGFSSPVDQAAAEEVSEGRAKMRVIREVSSTFSASAWSVNVGSTC
jgi:hypothetical protein